MRSEATTPEEFLAGLPEDWRRQTLERLRAIVLSEAPTLTEGIAYGMLSYSDDSRAVFHLAAQSAYVSLYVGDASKVDPGAELLEGLDVGKGCIRFSRSVDVAGTRIRQFIAKTAALATGGQDIDC